MMTENKNNKVEVMDDEFMNVAWTLADLLIPSDNDFARTASSFYGGVIHTLLSSKTAFNPTQVTETLNKANRKVISELLNK